MHYTRSTTFVLWCKCRTSDSTHFPLIVLYLLLLLCSWRARCMVLSQSDHWLSHCTEMYVQPPHDLSCRTWRLTCRTTEWIEHIRPHSSCLLISTSNFHFLTFPFKLVNLLPVHKSILLFASRSSKSLADINCICHIHSRAVYVCASDNNDELYSAFTKARWYLHHSS